MSHEYLRSGFMVDWEGTDSKGYEMAYKLGCNAIHLENLPGHLTSKFLKTADLHSSNKPTQKSQED